MKQIFIAGTNTDTGKTYVTSRLLKGLHQQGLATLGIKPVASGCHYQNGGFYSDDALNIQQAASVQLNYETVNPFAFLPAIAPHIAAEQTGRSLSAEEVFTACRPALAHEADIALIEGAGGWHTPLNYEQTLADLVKLAQWPVILVVGMQLGCINHALLTAQAIEQAGVELAGWIANCITPDMEALQANLRTLESMIPGPCLGHIPYEGDLSGHDLTRISDHLQLTIM